MNFFWNLRQFLSFLSKRISFLIKIIKVVHVKMQGHSASISSIHETATSYRSGSQKQQITPTSLRKAFAFWCICKHENEKAVDYAKNLHRLGEFDTVEDFWGYYRELQTPEKLPPGYELILFDSEVKPIWEDEANENGGSIRLVVKSEQGREAWENLILDYIGEESDVTRRMVGVRTNFRDPNLIIDIWLRQFKEEEKLMFEDWIKKSTSLDAFGPSFGRPIFRYHPKKASTVMTTLEQIPKN